jgi:GTP-binding protein
MHCADGRRGKDCKMAFNPADSSLMISAGRTDQFPARPLPQTVFSGRSNVGKSSLINTLLGRRSLCRVSSSPGKTVTVNFYDVNGRLVFVDLPGYGYARRPASDRARWSALTESFFTANPSIGLLKYAVQLVDLGVGPTEDDLLMIGYLSRAGIPFAVVASKADKLGKTAAAGALSRIRANGAIPADVPVIPFSSKTGQGRDELWRLIRSACGV